MNETQKPLVWGSYMGHLQHLFAGKRDVQSECGEAYCGDRGLSTPSKRRLCKYCEAIAREKGFDVPKLD